MSTQALALLLAEGETAKAKALKDWLESRAHGDRADIGARVVLWRTHFAHVAAAERYLEIARTDGVELVPADEAGIPVPTADLAKWFDGAVTRIELASIGALSSDVPADLRAVLEKHFGAGAHLAGNRAQSLDYVLLRAAGMAHEEAQRNAGVMEGPRD